MTYILIFNNYKTKTEDLKKANKCMVWTDGPLGSKHVTEVNGELAKQQQTCWLMNAFLCTYTDYEFKPGSSEIKSSLPPEDLSAS